jgi:hypothetical protein
LKRLFGDVADRVTVPGASGLLPEQVRDLLTGLR